MTTIKTVYLAGKITGDKDYRTKFLNAAIRLEYAGYAVANPAWLPPEGFAYDAYMRMSAAMLAECEAVCFLADWQESEGALLEHELAQKDGKEIFYYEDWLLAMYGKNAQGEAGANGTQHET